MLCPNCRSEYLMIRRRTGWERVMIWATSLRKYRCRDCARVFRAPDRRRLHREEESRLLAQTSGTRVVP